MFLTKFKKNRRGYFSFLILSFLFFFTLFADIVANDKPLLLEFGGHFYFPIFEEISEKQLGGIFETRADFRDPFVQDLVARACLKTMHGEKELFASSRGSFDISDFGKFSSDSCISEKNSSSSSAQNSTRSEAKSFKTGSRNGLVIFPPIKFSYDTINYQINSPAPSKPTSTNILGTDDQGRDVLARAIYGIRISLIFGLILAAVSAVIGIFLGAIQGYFGGLCDLLLQRFIEIWSSMPVLFLLIILSSIIEPGFFVLLGLMLLFSWLTMVSFVRAEFLRLRNFDFVRASRALGASNWRIIFRHIMPNASPIIIANLPFLLASSIATLTSLDFLGLGLPAGSPSLGELLSQGKNNLNAYWLGLTGFTITTLILALLVFIGEGLRDAMDSRK